MSACSLPFLPAATTSAAETRALGQRLAAALAPGAVVALHGALGAGKTQLVKGVAAGLGVDPAAVSSPTFTLIHEYAGAAPVYHMDGYRTKRPEEFLALGVEEYLYGDGVCLIEWPERLGDLLPSDTLHLELTHQGGDTRHIRQRGADAESPNG
ncbi:MAG: tRNA (adenosine(37)-N6)-threonylcarbamoyltransferase complex ATPase subunit type 1 TsaE [Bacteroidetes bacterium]|jgi:tRNA threonylcarbamoyladenosine biosynthesis protein TsaE|nr:tRNA (adenosine(37)-N6)-threonylcarbamoyltransferase complex ATPase subunit type 1 TsaE [Bacteroidota bacterium]